MKMIGDNWFAGCQIESVEIPASVKIIGAEAFYLCKNLKRVVFMSGSKLEKANSGNLCRAGPEKMTVPSATEQIPERTLKEYAGKKNSMPWTIEKSAFNSCDNLAEINIPERFKSIECCAFQNCKSLKSIRLPDGLEKIGALCFQNSCLEEIILPASVKEVGAWAFYDCK